MSAFFILMMACGFGLIGFAFLKHTSRNNLDGSLVPPYVRQHLQAQRARRQN
jgi:hypothetical protein